MTRDDCLWLAYRCAGLVLIVLAIVTTPQLVTAILMYVQARPMSMNAEVGGLAQSVMGSSDIATAVLYQAVLQVAIPGVAGLVLLFGFRGSALRASAGS